MSTSKSSQQAWRQAFEIVDRMLEIDAPDRARYLDGACPSPAIRDKVDALLAAADDEGFLDGPAVQYVAPLAPTIAAGGMPVDRIGAYRVIREIGRGGMGAVFLAERDDRQFQRRVALKVLSRWAPDERTVRRFLDERQILARLQHADIAQLFDGGVMPGGLPWFAMEYVEGTPIDRHCREHGLDLDARLRLFVRVCGAVQYAHRNLVIHRDLKPANILVQADGSVKLLDFGIAKLVDDEHDPLTMTGERLMTPMYASPEQIRGEPVTTASDVYALGVLLFEMLTGESPYRINTREPYEVVRSVLEHEPRRPSDVAPPKLARRLRGDIDVIVATAMRKDATTRYGSVEQLAADVERYLRGRPLAARPQPPLARAWKFVQRHRAGAAAAVLFTVTVLAFAVVASVQALRIREERIRAEQVSTFLAGLFRNADPFASAGPLTARELLDSGSARVDRDLLAQPAARAQLHLAIGGAYLGLGDAGRARRSVATSLIIQRREAEPRPAQLAEGNRLLGEILLQQGNVQAAERAYRTALDAQRTVTRDLHPDMARVLDGLASALRAGGRFRQADSISLQAVAINQALGDGARLDLAESLRGLGESELALGNASDAVSSFRRALASSAALGLEHPRTLRIEGDLARALGDAGQRAAADSLFRHALAAQRRLLGAGHPDVLRTELGYARSLHDRRLIPEALAVYVHALTESRRTLAPVTPLAAEAVLGMGAVDLERGRIEDAEKSLRHGLAMWRALLPLDHPQVAMAEQLLGEATMRRGRSMEAETYLVLSQERLRAAFGPRDARTRAALGRIVALYEGMRLPSEAARYRERLETNADDPAPLPRTALRNETAATPGARVHVAPLRLVQSEAALVDLRDWFHDLTRSALEAPTDSAQERAATFALDGSIAQDGGRIATDVRLVDRRSGAVRGRWRFSGAADSLPQMADALAVAVLASLGSEVPGDSSQLAAVSLRGLQSFLRGRAIHRSGQRPADARRFEEALALDSGFALASMWLAINEEATGSAGSNFRWRYETAWRQRDRLPPAARALLVAHLGPNYPRASGMRELYRSTEDARRLAPQWAEAWFSLGEHLGRYGSLMGLEDTRLRQLEAFERAYALDPNHLQALDNLIVIAATVGDTARVRRLAPEFREKKAAGENAYFARWCIAVVLDEADSLRVLRSQLSELPDMDLRRLAVWADWKGQPTDDGIHAAEALFRRAAVMRERTSAMNQLVPTLLNRGYPDSANRILAGAARGFGQNQGVGGVREFQVYAYLYWDGDSAVAARAVETLESFRKGEQVPTGEVGTQRTASCALAHWWMALGQFERAREALSLSRRVPPVRTAAVTPGSPICEAGVEAQLAARAGGREAREALARLESQLESVQNVRDHLLTIGNLIAARLHENNGDRRRALAFLRRRANWNVYLSTQLREEARLALSLRDTGSAVDAYRQYVGLRWRTEARLASDAAEARRVLSRLEGRTR